MRLLFLSRVATIRVGWLGWHVGRWWVPAAVTLDITLRFIGFPSPTKQVSIIIVRQLREWVGGGRPSWGNTVEAGAPKQVGGGVVPVEMRVNTPNTPSLAPPRATAAREPSLAHHARCIVVVYSFWCWLLLAWHCHSISFPQLPL